MNEITNVLITGTGGGGTGRELMKAFKMASHKYNIVATDLSPTSFGLYETSSKYLIPPASSDVYIEKLLKICKLEKIQAISSGSEPELRKISKNAELFEEKGIKVLLNPWNVVEKCTDKFELMNFLASNGFGYPNYFLYEEENDLNKISNYPIIIKPRIGGGSQNVFLALDFNEAKFFATYLKKYGMEPLIQDYVGDENEEYTIGVLYADNGKLLTSIAMKRMLGSGLSTRQTIVNPKDGKKYVISSGISQGLIDDFKEIRASAEKIVKTLGANGPVNIQCRKVNSQIIPFEINPRFSGTTGPRSLVGYNEPDIFCRYRLYGEIPEKTSYDFGYVIRELAEKYISVEEINKVPKI
jgi:carbamoyl-phosphate synthase large subunit